jgi:hypothetical protein
VVADIHLQFTRWLHDAHFKRQAIKSIGNPVLSVTEFAKVIADAGATMNKAVANPVEGTLVSVIRESCIKAGKGSYTTVHELIAAWHVRCIAFGPKLLCSKNDV